MARKNMARRWLPLVVLASASLLWTGSAGADAKDGVDAWSRGDYGQAISEWKGLADKGDADAQFNLAQAYKMGRGVERDLMKAEELYGKAAAQGHLQAGDNYGLLLFQRGERDKALPFIQASADRGNPPAQYVLGLAYFNGDMVPKDWIRAYALVSLAQQAGLPQATGALSQMDQYIPLDQRQKSVPLAAELSAKAEATRRTQVSAIALDSKPSPVDPTSPATAQPLTPKLASSGTAGTPASLPGREAKLDSPATAGADFTQSSTPAASQTPRVTLPPTTKAAPAKPAEQPAKAPAASGPWRVQLGAFGVAANADKLWARVRNRPELAGHPKLTVQTGKLTRLQAGGFASRSEAEAACSRLKAAGFACLPVGS